MSALTGNQIKNSYQGLLKLADSSTGITQNLQAIQDGLGGNTGLRLAINQLEAPNIPSYVPLKGQYYGAGYAVIAPQANAAGTQNIILAIPFYDPGQYEYSAMTYNVVSATTSSDTVEAALYTSQLANPYGLCPYEPVISGLTIDVATSGIKTLTFPSNISFSGYGAGIYWMVWKITNSGVTPTLRFGGNVPQPGFAFQVYGLTEGVNGAYNVGPRNNTNSHVYTGTTTFQNPYPPSLPTTQSTTTTVQTTNLGFLLHTV